MAPADVMRPEAARLRLAAAAQAAGAVALKAFRPGARADAVVSWKEGNSPVTEADHAANAVLFEALHDAGSGIGWFSEETPDDGARLTRRALFVVDPIDGTRAFMSGDPQWSVSVALVVDGEAVAGAVHAPALGETISAARGGGAWLNGAVLRISHPASSPMRLAGPRPWQERLAPALGDVTLLPRIRSLALRLVSVAAGRADAALAGGNAHDWDIAAADVILSEAGASLVSLAGQTPVYNRVVPVHPALIAGTDAVRAALIAAETSMAAAAP